MSRQVPPSRSRAGWTRRSAPVCGLLSLLACGNGETVAESASRSGRDLIVSHVFAPAPAAPDVMSLYFSIENTGRRDDTLLTIETASAETARVHESVTANGVTRMRERVNLPLPAGQTVELAPGGLHVMLSNLTQSVTEGDTIEVDLVFASAEPLSLRVPVVSYADAASR